jgi:hypothetical protein
MGVVFDDNARHLGARKGKEKSGGGREPEGGRRREKTWGDGLSRRLPLSDSQIILQHFTARTKLLLEICLFVL